MKKNITIALVLTSLSLLAITGCSTTGKQPAAFTSGPTTKQVLMNRKSSNHIDRYRASQQHRNKGNHYGSYTRTEQKELHGLFPRLPNPDLCMWVAPHLSHENATVPGYTSCFSMYETNQYALPGESSSINQ